MTTKRVRDIPDYKHRYDAYGILGGQRVNLSDLTNNDFKKAIVDILCANGLLAGVKTEYQLRLEKIAEELKK